MEKQLNKITQLKSALLFIIMTCILVMGSYSQSVNTKPVSTLTGTSKSMAFAGISLTQKESHYCEGNEYEFTASGADTYEWFFGTDSVYYVGTTIKHKIRPIDNILSIRGSIGGLVADSVQENMTIYSNISFHIRLNGRVSDDSIHCLDDKPFNLLIDPRGAQWNQITWSTSSSGVPVLRNDSVFPNFSTNISRRLYALIKTPFCNFIDSINLYILEPYATADTTEFCPGGIAVVKSFLRESPYINLDTTGIKYSWSSIPEIWTNNTGRIKIDTIRDSDVSFKTGMTISGKYCYSESILIKLIKLPILTADIRPPYIDMQEPTVFFDDISPHRYTTQWFFGDDDSLKTKYCNHTYNLDSLKGKDSIEVRMISKNKLECSHDTNYMLPIKQIELEFPNSFMPDEQNNAVFKPLSNSTELNNYRLRIYNRWGELLFESKDVDIGWDGKNLKGEYCASGSYVWMYTSRRFENQRTYTQRGNVMLVR